MTDGSIVLPPNLVASVEGQSAILFLGAATSIGAHHLRGDKIPDTDRLRDALCDEFLGGEDKGKPLMTVAELAVNEANLIAVQQFVREKFLDFRPAAFHFLIPQFRWHAIATTNFDLIVERAYDPARKPLQELVM